MNKALCCAVIRGHVLAGSSIQCLAASARSQDRTMLVAGLANGSSQVFQLQLSNRSGNQTAARISSNNAMMEPLNMIAVPCTEHVHLSWRCAKCKVIYCLQRRIFVEHFTAVPFVACVKIDVHTHAPLKPVSSHFKWALYTDHARVSYYNWIFA